MVAARIVDELPDNQVAVEVPDGKVIVVDKGNTKKRPTPITPPARTSAVPTTHGVRVRRTITETECEASTNTG